MRWGLVAALLFAAACGDDEGPDGAADAGVDAADGDAGDVDPGPELTPPAAPEAPELAVLGDCPDGWRLVADPDLPEVVTCDPWPEDGIEDCAAGTVQLPGAATCEGLGAPCVQDDDWAPAVAAPVGDTLYYVKADAPPLDADGTRDHPYPTIAAALQRATSGDVIALAKGTYAERVDVTRGVTLWGACAEETTLEPATGISDDDPLGAIEVTGEGAVIRDLRITGGRPGVVVQRRGAATLESVDVDGTVAEGVRVRGGELVARRLRIHGVIPDDSDPSLAGIGLWATESAEVTLEGVSIEGTIGVGLVSSDPGTSVSGVRVALRASQFTPAAIGGQGALAGNGGALELAEVAVDGNSYAGVWALDPDSRLALTDARLQNVEPDAAGLAGAGALVTTGATLSLERVSVVRCHTNGVVAQEEGVLTASHLAVVDTQPGRVGPRSAETGFGITIVLEAEATLDHVFLARNLVLGIQVGGADATIDDLWAGTTRIGPVTGGVAGDAIQILDEGHLALTRAELVANEVHGIVVADGTLEATSLRIADTAPDASVVDPTSGGYPGQAIIVYGTAEVNRASIEGNRVVAIAAALGGTLTLRDAVVRDTRSTDDGQWGDGVDVADGATATLERVELAANHLVGVNVFGEGSTATLSDVWAHDTLPADCAATTCPTFAWGMGLATLEGATVDVTGFRLTDNALAGVLVAGAALDLHTGLVAGHAIGASVQDADYETGRLQDHVAYRDNERNLDYDEIPIPAQPSF